MEDFVGGSTTTTSFLATVTESSPFRFDAIHAQTRSSLRITHIAMAPESGGGAALLSSLPTFAQVRTLSAPTAEVTTTTIAGFPAPSCCGKGGLVSSCGVVSSLNVVFDLDAFSELVVSGPGTLLFFGEQHSQLIDENLHHDMFDDEIDDEEGDFDGGDDDGFDLSEVMRLSRE